MSVDLNKSDRDADDVLHYRPGSASSSHSSSSSCSIVRVNDDDDEEEERKGEGEEEEEEGEARKKKPPLRRRKSMAVLIGKTGTKKKLLKPLSHSLTKSFNKGEASTVKLGGGGAGGSNKKTKGKQRKESMQQSIDVKMFEMPDPSDASTRPTSRGPSRGPSAMSRRGSLPSSRPGSSRLGRHDEHGTDPVQLNALLNSVVTAALKVPAVAPPAPEKPVRPALSLKTVLMAKLLVSRWRARAAAQEAEAANKATQKLKLPEAPPLQRARGSDVINPTVNGMRQFGISRGGISRVIVKFVTPPPPHPLTLCFHFPGTFLTHRYVLDMVRSKLTTVENAKITGIQFIDR